MSLNSLHAASIDQALTNRTIASVVQEAVENPAVADTAYAELVRDNPAEGVRMVWPVAIATEAEYASALAADNPNPGGDESVITDGAILSAVQANWPPDVP